MRSSQGQVLVLGGSGFYGRYLVADLLKHTASRITIASRNPKSVLADTGRISLAACDLANLPELVRLAGTCDVVAHCAGPFQRLPLNPLHAAIAAGCDYIDLAEDRLFGRRVRQLAGQIETAGIRVFTGLSVCPAMEAIFAGMLKPGFDCLTSIRTFAAPDTRKQRGPAMFHTMLWGVGRGWDQLSQGKLKRVYGWTEPEWIEFPPPVKRRLTFLVLEMANLDLLPEIFGVETVAFKAGTEHFWLNRTLNLAAKLRARTGFPSWERLTPVVRVMSWLAGRLGRDAGGVIFEVGGMKNGKSGIHRIALMAQKDGGFIPSALAAILVDEILRGHQYPSGLVPLSHWIDPSRLLASLRERGLNLWWQESAEAAWNQLTGEQQCLADPPGRG